jgi:hypothetical protein
MSTNYVYQTAIKYSKWSQNIPTFTIQRPSKIYPNLVFFVWKQTIWQPCLVGVGAVHSPNDWLNKISFHLAGTKKRCGRHQNKICIESKITEINTMNGQTKPNIKPISFELYFFNLQRPAYHVPFCGSYFSRQNESLGTYICHKKKCLNPVYIYMYAFDNIIFAVWSQPRENGFNLFWKS